MVRRISDAVDGLNIRVLVLPPLRDMLGGGAPDGFSDFRDVAVEDLIGRRPVDIKVDEIAGYIKDKRVLVTGAGGSIGSELCRQIVQFSPAELIMLDHDETGLQQTQISITGAACWPAGTPYWPTSATARRCRRSSRTAAPKWSSMRPPSSTRPCSSSTGRSLEDQRLRDPERAARRPGPASRTS